MMMTMVATIQTWTSHKSKPQSKSACVYQLATQTFHATTLAAKTKKTQVTIPQANSTTVMGTMVTMVATIQTRTSHKTRRQSKKVWVYQLATQTFHATTLAAKTKKTQVTIPQANSTTVMGTMVTMVATIQT